MYPYHRVVMYGELSIPLGLRNHHRDPVKPTKAEGNDRKEVIDP